MSACRWCQLDHYDALVRHRACKVCGETWTESVHRGRPRQLCRRPLCVAVDKWWRTYGRWPPRVFFERYAKRRGLLVPQPIKLPRRIEKIAAGPTPRKEVA